MEWGRDVAPENLGLRSSDWLSRARHRWYYVKEGFAPAFVEGVLREEGVKEGELLVDPFSGGGTVSLVGAERALRTEAWEVNPFLYFVSKAKLARIGKDCVARGSDRALDAMRQPVESRLEGYSTFTKGNRWGRWLFPTSVIRAFEAAKRVIMEMQEGGCRDVMMLALIGAAMDCCNAARDGKCLRFRKGWEEREASAMELAEEFGRRIEDVAVDLAADPLPGKSVRLHEGDVREGIYDPGDSFRICITSPPYLNSFDYSDIYRPELFLGDFVASTTELMDIRLRTVRSHLQASWELAEDREFGETYAECAEELLRVNGSLWDRRVSAMVQAYFEDLKRVLAGLHVRAAGNASVWMVVSTSAYGGVEVPVDRIVAEVGESVGWAVRGVKVVRRLRASSQHVARGRIGLRESVVVFDGSE